MLMLAFEFVTIVRKFFDKRPVIAVVGEVKNITNGTAFATPASEFEPCLKVSDQFRVFVTASRAN